MNIIYFILIFLFSQPKADLTQAAQFTLYTDGKSITIRTTINKDYYNNDCEALFDLFQMKEDICSLAEIEAILKRLTPVHPIPNYNKL